MEAAHDFFAVAVPGTEPFVATELTELGIAFPQRQDGGVAFSASLSDARRLSQQLHTPTRLLLRMGEFPAIRFAELVRKTANLNWASLLRSGQEFRVRATCRHSKLYHSSAVEQRIRTGIEEGLQSSAASYSGAGARESEPPLIVARLEDNHCTLSITIGSPDLHRRGYRQETAKAPLRENLAAVLLYAADWDSRTPLIDPFCGSGTIAIEATLLAARRDIAAHDRPLILAADRDAGACRMTQANADRARNAADCIQIRNQSVSDLLPPDTAVAGHIITNPPYGKRVNSSRDLRNLYARFGTVLREGFSGWQLTMLCTAGAEGDILTGQMGLPLKTVATFSNGGLPVGIRSCRIPQTG